MNYLSEKSLRAPIANRSFVSRHLRGFCISWLLLVFVTLSSAPCHAAFVVTGSGTAANASADWVAGETIDLSFTYELSSFDDDLFTADPSIGIYLAPTPIPLAVTGSISGAISALGPISRVVAHNNDASGDQLKFENSNATGVAQAFEKTDVTQSALPTDPALSFTALHAQIFPSIANESPWTSSSAVIFLSVTNTNLLLESFQWTVVEQQPLTADFDFDGDVDNVDLLIWEVTFGLAPVADADGDGDTDGNDFLIWQREFTGPGPLAATTVPEPSTLMLLLGSVAIGLCMTRHTGLLILVRSPR